MSWRLLMQALSASKPSQPRCGNAVGLGLSNVNHLCGSRELVLQHVPSSFRSLVPLPLGMRVHVEDDDLCPYPSSTLFAGCRTPTVPPILRIPESSHPHPLRKETGMVAVTMSPQPVCSFLNQAGG